MPGQQPLPGAYGCGPLFCVILQLYCRKLPSLLHFPLRNDRRVKSSPRLFPGMLPPKDRCDITIIPSVLPQAAFQVLIAGDCEMKSHIIYLLIKDVDESSGEASFSCWVLRSQTPVCASHTRYVLVSCLVIL